MEDLTHKFLGYGDGDGDGSGSGDGDGSGSGDGYGYGYGSGDGYGSGSGYGYGYGSGSGSGSGDGYGSGSGSGDGDGYGSGYGSGSGSGYGDGIKSVNGNAVHIVDGISTLIYRVRGNIAKGALLNLDFSLTPCYIVKQANRFAHGVTLHAAMDALRDKLFADMPEKERIEAFVQEHQWGVEYPDSDYFDWHHRLTGSCEMGRKSFAAERGLEKLDGKRTVESFIELTRNAYGGDVIRRLDAAYKEGRR